MDGSIEKIEKNGGRIKEEYYEGTWKEERITDGMMYGERKKKLNNLMLQMIYFPLNIGNTFECYLFHKIT